jgi:hypothetical protein
MKVYLHGPLDSPTNRALFYNTKYWDDFAKIIILDPSHEIGDDLREKLTEHVNTFLIKNNFILDKEFKKICEEGIHIVPSDIERLQDIITDCGSKSKYYIFDTANLETLDIFDNINKIKDSPNCIFFTSLWYEFPNKKFDFGILLRKFISNRIVYEHYHCNEIFKKTPKQYRLDLSIRNFPGKDERIQLLNSLKNHDKDNIYLRVNDYYVNRMQELRNFATKHNNSDKLEQYNYEFSILDKIKSSVVKTSDLVSGIENYHIGTLKLFEVTLSSDIQIMFESNKNTSYKFDPIRYCNITEKTIDNLLIEKPFIICSEVAYVFLNVMGFETYEEELGINYKDVFDDVNLTIRKLEKNIVRISELPEDEYQIMLSRLMKKSTINRQKCLKYIENNSILDKIITDKI